ncbi:zinc knuckle domain containing protein, partial [Entamoeba invadens IP1]|uniref:zinc knuckle domain containing protein n=1 Tax=Entamoeba invadens IP1 TaxID=370355 RepID=UPI0002C3DAED
KGRLFDTFDSFCDAMDEFHSHIEKQEYEEELEKKDATMKKKIQAVIDGHEKRYKGLLEKAEEMVVKAKVVESHIIIVDQLIKEINVFLSEKMQWERVEEIIQSAKENDPTSVAQYIKKFDFANDVVVLSLENANNQKIDVDVLLTKNGFENVRNFYEMRRVVLAKADKTLESRETAIQQATQKQERVAKTKQIDLADLKKMRRRFWFEKFHWFISSENFVIISGKDALQNDVMYRRYMKNTDIYVHADIHGAASCLIKGVKGKVIGAATLEQAGKVAVCRSSAWTNKIVTSAYWVYSDQVSKTAPSGEYLVTGSFMIRGKKNYLPPAPLVFGLGIVFAVEKTEKEETEFKEDNLQILGETEGKVAKGEMKEGEKKEEKAEIAESVLERSAKYNEQIEEKATQGIDAKATDDKSDTTKVTIDDIQFKKVEYANKDEEEQARRLAHKEEMKKQQARLMYEKQKKSEEDAKRQEKEANKSANKKTRGQLRKEKKLKKYVEQDEEDRLRMAERIGHKFEEEKKPVAVVVEEEKTVKELMCHYCGSKEHIARDCPKRLAEVNKKKQDDEKAKAEKVEKNAKDEVDDDEEEEQGVDDVVFVGELKEGMNVRYAAPICGPYECVTKYKYHLKITPGKLKAGKAVKSVMSMWGTWKDMTQLEKALIGGITTDEYTGVLMGDVTIHPPTGKVKTKKWTGGSGKAKKEKKVKN